MTAVIWALFAPFVLGYGGNWAFARLAGAVNWQRRALLVWAGDGALIAVIYASVGLWLAAGFAGLNLVIALAIWWYRRRKRRNVAALVGAKSRALRDALIRRAKEATRPSPVLRPSLRGAR